MNQIKNILTLLSLLFLAACGSGGETTTSSQQPPAASSVNLTVVLQGSATASVKGIQATITIPAGVVLRADGTGKIMSDVITKLVNTPSGTIEGIYSAAVVGTPATATFFFITSGNFIAGDILNVNADISSGTTAPTAAAFTLSGIRLVDADGIDVIGPSLILR